jgi:enamine deaminase RidA (YjgF/YER057c/UK114 family)
MRAQIEQVCKNIKTCLEAAGASLADVVETTTYATNLDEFFEHVDVRSKSLRRRDIPQPAVPSDWARAAESGKTGRS